MTKGDRLWGFHPCGQCRTQGCVSLEAKRDPESAEWNPEGRGPGERPPVQRSNLLATPPRPQSPVRPPIGQRQPGSRGHDPLIGSMRAGPPGRKVKGSESRSVVPDSLRPHGLCRPCNPPGRNTGVGSLSLLQGIFPTQGSNVSRIVGGRILPVEPQGKSPRQGVQQSQFTFSFCLGWHFKREGPVAKFTFSGAQVPTGAGCFPGKVF